MGDMFHQAMLIDANKKTKNISVQIHRTPPSCSGVMLTFIGRARNYETNERSLPTSRKSSEMRRRRGMQRR